MTRRLRTWISVPFSFSLFPRHNLSYGRPFAVLAVVVMGLIPAFSARAVPFIVEKGKSKAEIVIAENPARAAKFAARELQTYLEKMSGAKLPIVSKRADPDVIPIYVGKSNYTAKLGLETDGLKHGAYRMASGPDWMALLGPDKDFEPVEPWGRNRSRPETDRVNAEWDKITGDTFWNNFREVYARYHPELDLWDYDDLGTLNAVYEFLRELGVHWYAPGEIGEVVPTKTEIALPDVNRTVEPDFALRRYNYFYDYLGIPEISLWNLRLGVNYGHDLIGMTQAGHGMKFVLMRDEMKKAHPEFYALWNGERATDHKSAGAPSLGAKGLKEKHLNYARKVFDHYDEPMISLDVVDGFSARISEEDSSQATPERGWAGSMSDYVWGYVDAVARGIYKSHPDKMVSGLAYSAYMLPPEKIETMSPNLAIIECRHRSRLGDPVVRERHREIRKAWLEKLPSKQYFTWDYYLHAWGKRNPGRPVYFPSAIAQDLRDLKGVSLGDMIEVYNHRPDKKDEFDYDEFAVNHLNLYVTSRLWWDADQDLAALLDEYYTNYYGPARDQMKAFIEYSEENWGDMNRDHGKIDRALELLRAAVNAAKPGSVYEQRIQRVVDYVRPMEELSAELKVGRQNVPEMMLPTRDTGDFNLDGKLDDAFWADVPGQSLRELKNGGVPTQATGFMAAIGDDGMLYFAIRCEDADMKNITVTSTRDGEFEIWNGDFVELLIETPMHSYYQITVGPNGNIIDLDRNEGFSDGWTSGVDVAVHRGADYWSVEFRVPPAGAMAAEIDSLAGIAGDLPSLKAPWYVNVCRSRVRDQDVELSAWSPTGESFHKPVPFAQKVFGRLLPAE